jgi:hypothetical protein
MNATRISGAIALLLPALLAAQAPAAAPAPVTDPVSTAARGINKRYSGFLTAAADQVPADKLGYKPTPAQLSFGDVWAHLVEANFGICGAIAGAPAANAPKVKGTDSKDALVSALKASFTYCEGVLAKQTDGNLGETVDMGFMKGSRALAMFIYLGDLADHYSQVSNYMRLNGMLPPSAQPKKAM